MILKNPDRETRSLTPLFIGVAFFLVLILVETILIVSANNGKLVYTLDDPYIHLALAENIMHGHYGVNAVEFSAPSSSIIWPFLLAPISFSAVSPLILNVIFGVGTLFFVWLIMSTVFNIPQRSIKNSIIAAFLVLFVLGANLIGLASTGMEHVLQVMMVAAITWGLVLEAEKGKTGFWLIFFIVAAPLVRYENLAISAAAIIYLAFRRHFKLSILALVISGLTLGAFSLFLVKMGLKPIPTSVIVKLGETGAGFSIGGIISHVKYSLAGPPQGMLLVIGMVVLLFFSLFSKQSTKQRALAFAASAAIVCHLVAGGYGWYHRYEIYIWAFLLLILLYLFRGAISNLFTKSGGGKTVLRLIGVTTVSVLLICSEYIWDLSTIPYAANNIYNQHYQMHRFAVDYYKKPVAVNDIGYVTYKNPNYVLDLWGLSSLEALNNRLHHNNDLTHMNSLMERHNVKLAMIYTGWFQAIQEEWVKIGELIIDMDENKKIGPAERNVAFFVINADVYEAVVGQLTDYIKTLPKGVEFVFEGEG